MCCVNLFKIQKNAKWDQNTHRFVTFHILLTALTSCDFHTREQAMQHEHKLT